MFTLTAEEKEEKKFRCYTGIVAALVSLMSISLAMPTIPSSIPASIPALSIWALLGDILVLSYIVLSLISFLAMGSGYEGKIPWSFLALCLWAVIIVLSLVSAIITPVAQRPTLQQPIVLLILFWVILIFWPLLEMTDWMYVESEHRKLPERERRERLMKTYQLNVEEATKLLDLLDTIWGDLPEDLKKFIPSQIEAFDRSENPVAPVIAKWLRSQRINK